MGGTWLSPVHQGPGTLVLFSVRRRDVEVQPSPNQGLCSPDSGCKALPCVWGKTAGAHPGPTLVLTSEMGWGEKGKVTHLRTPCWKNVRMVLQLEDASLW